MEVINIYSTRNGHCSYQEVSVKYVILNRDRLHIFQNDADLVNYVATLLNSDEWPDSGILTLELALDWLDNQSFYKLIKR